MVHPRARIRPISELVRRLASLLHSAISSFSEPMSGGDPVLRDSLAKGLQRLLPSVFFVLGGFFASSGGKWRFLHLRGGVLRDLPLSRSNPLCSDFFPSISFFPGSKLQRVCQWPMTSSAASPPSSLSAMNPPFPRSSSCPCFRPAEQGGLNVYSGVSTHSAGFVQYLHGL